MVDRSIFVKARDGEYCGSRSVRLFQYSPDLEPFCFVLVYNRYRVCAIDWERRLRGLDPPFAKTLVDFTY
jgi:hypothetical protein